MKVWKWTFSLLLCLVLCLGVLPGMASAVEEEENGCIPQMAENDMDIERQPQGDCDMPNAVITSEASGSNYTSSPALAAKLDSIFAGNASIYANNPCWSMVNTALGSYSVPDDGVILYVGPYGGYAINSGTSCWIYANGVYYSLFDECTGNGEPGPNSTRLYLGNNTDLSYSNMHSWGVRNGVGTLIRVGTHSIIVLRYSETTLTYLDGNGDGNGLVAIREYPWNSLPNAISKTVQYIIQPTDEYYNSKYPDSLSYLDKCTYYPSHCVVKMYKDFRMWSLPCSNETDPSSEIVASNISKNEELTVTAMYKNTAESSAHYWYRVKRSNGQEGYVYCPFTDFQRCLNDDVYITGENYPVLSEPKSFSITGQIRADYCQIDTVRGAIVGTSSDLTVPVNGQYYDLHHSDIDYALAFNSLSPNTTYTYLIQATCSSNYCASRTNNPLCSQPATVTLINHTFTVGGHTHDYNQRGYEAAHPHKVYVKCSCGDWYYTGETEIVTSCDECKTEYMDPGKPELIGLKTLYRPNENIVFVWNDTVNTTHYNLYTEQRNGGGSYEDLSADFYAVSGMVKTLPVGDYRVLLQSTNSNYWTDDGSTWRYTNGDWSYFQVAEEITSYTITYDANGGTGAPEAQTKTKGQPLTLSTVKPTRTGFYFLGWSENRNATTADYKPGESYTLDKDATLYAVWLKSITYPVVGGDVYFRSDTGAITSCSSGVTEADIPAFIEGYPVKSIASNAFRFSKLKRITLPEGLESIGAYTFYDTSIQEIVIPDSVKSIGSYAFSGCQHMTYLKIGSGVKALDANFIFEDCRSLQKVVLNVNLTKIAFGTFSACQSIQDVFYSGSKTQWNQIDIGEWNEDLTGATIHYNSNGPTYQITYDANGGTGAPAVQAKTQGQPLTLSTVRPTREGYEFLGWAESKNATAAQYQPGGSFTKDADTTLYAVWNETSSGDLPTLFLENKSVAPGEIVTLDVVLTEPIMAKALLFYQFEFDRSALTLIKGEWKLNNAIIANWDAEEEIASAAFAQNMQLEGGVFSLTFQVKDNANGTYHIGLSPIIKVLSGTQETELEVDFQPGTLNVSPHKPGDANGDGAVTSDDAIYLLYHCFFPDVYPVTQSCDFNGDGAEDDADAIYLLYHVFFPDLYPIG